MGFAGRGMGWNFVTRVLPLTIPTHLAFLTYFKTFFFCFLFTSAHRNTCRNTYRSKHSVVAEVTCGVSRMMVEWPITCFTSVVE